MQTVELSARVPSSPVATAVIVTSVFPAPMEFTGTRNAPAVSCWLITNTAPICGSLARVANESVLVAVPPDEDVAKKLHTAIETYSVPKDLQRSLGIRKMGRVFRDQEELPLSQDLGSDIRTALEHSEWLIVICSPRYLESKWCNAELDYFIELGKRDHILAVLADKSCPTGIYDGSLVLGNLMLAAHSLGLGSIWIHRAKEEFEMPRYRELLKTLGISGEWEGVGHCAVGFADCDLPAPPPRKPDRVFRA